MRLRPTLSAAAPVCTRGWHFPTGLPDCGAAPRDKLLRPADANTATLDGRPGGERGYKRRNAHLGRLSARHCTVARSARTSLAGLRCGTAKYERKGGARTVGHVGRRRSRALPKGNSGRVPSRPFERARTWPDNCATPPSTEGTAKASAVGHGTGDVILRPQASPEIPPSAANATALLGEPEAAGRFLQARRGIRRRFAVMCGRSRHGDVTGGVRSARKGDARPAVPPSAASVSNR